MAMAKRGMRGSWTRDERKVDRHGRSGAGNGRCTRRATRVGRVGIGSVVHGDDDISSPAVPWGESVGRERPPNESLPAVRERRKSRHGRGGFARLGFEPRQREPKSLVLPLHHRAPRHFLHDGWAECQPPHRASRFRRPTGRKGTGSCLRARRTRKSLPSPITRPDDPRKYDRAGHLVMPCPA